ncbi:Branched-chain amino acid aminotransferase [Chondromyces apiculatus DSM 436]|uniref:branched-chain-amino-acid transaminase n=1 Tax=Chondromyces apiculatus DSM 436 TaxID=1192034 RepID=A0A017T8R8_9BACT|nr:Branched-chain amino acid aminotransferase [Chondromyces apiculatus DSM 436]
MILQPEEAKVSVYDRGFLYGDSVFETIRTYAGEPFALDEHLARLERSAGRVAIPLPLPRADFALEIRRAIRAARNPESYVRAMITRGSGPMGLDTGLAEKALRVVLVEPLQALPATMYRDGVAVTTFKTRRAADEVAQGAKVSNYLTSMMALKEARAAGAHEALILDGSGDVLEGTTSNVFALTQGVLVTPPEEAGILVGITRAHVLEVAGELGIPVRVERLPLETLRSATEVFITSTLREIVPVVRVDGQEIGARVPGRTTRAIHAAFRQKVGLGAEPLPWEKAGD